MTKCVIKYRDVILSADGLARNPDGYVFLNSPNIKNRKIIYGVAFNDFPFSVRNSSQGNWIAYEMWCSMLARCYSEAYRRRFKTYNRVTCCLAWQKFSGFLNWLLDQPYNSGFQLDKDLLSQGTEYNSENCILVPQWVNKITVDAKAARGEFSLGVRIRGSRFIASVCVGDGVQISKSFGDPDGASDWYYTKKREYVDSCKAYLDTLHPSLYKGICDILNERRLNEQLEKFCTAAVSRGEE